MKEYKNKVIVGICVVFGLSLLGIMSTTYAWQGANTLSNTCDLAYPGTADLVAASGDVVTTDKWNQIICYLKNTHRFIHDWPRVMTPFLVNFDNTINGQNGTVVRQINLGYDPARPSEQATIHFRDGSKSWIELTTKDIDGALTYATQLNDLKVLGFSGGVRIYPGFNVGTISPGADVNGYLLGWERVSLTDTTPFNPACQYRFTIVGDNERMYYPPAVNINHLGLTEIGDWSGDVAELRYLEIIYSAKTVLRNRASGGLAYPAHGAIVTKIEKLCLPAYNPENL